VINDGLVAAVTLLNELRAAGIEKGVVKGGRSARRQLPTTFAPSLS